MHRINDTAFLLYSPEEVAVSVTCRSQTEILKLSGLKSVNLLGGCRATVAGYTFLAALHPVFEVEHLVTVFPSDFFPEGLMVPEFVQTINDSLQSFDAIDLRTLKKQGEELRALKPWEKDSSSLTWFWVIFIGLAVIVVLFIVVCLIYRDKIKFLWSLTSDPRQAMQMEEHYVPAHEQQELFDAIRSWYRATAPLRANAPPAYQEPPT